MAEYLNKEMFLQSMGLLGDETKYGNRDGEHQSRSYSTWMGYEIMNSVEDSVVEEDLAEVVLCQNCTHHDTESCPENRVWCKMLRRYMSLDGYCSYGERENDEKLV